MTRHRTAQPYTTIQTWPSGTNYDYRGDPHGHANRRSLRITAPVGAPAKVWRSGTPHEWEAVQFALRREQQEGTLRQMHFSPTDHVIAHKIAAHMGYAQTACTSTSALIGLFCLAENPARNPQNRPTVRGCIIKTRELGFLFVQDAEDLGFDDLGQVPR